MLAVRAYTNSRSLLSLSCCSNTQRPIMSHKVQFILGIIAGLSTCARQWNDASIKHAGDRVVWWYQVLPQILQYTAVQLVAFLLFVAMNKVKCAVGVHVVYTRI